METQVSLQILEINVVIPDLFQGLPVWRLHHDLIAVSSAVGLHCYLGSLEVNLSFEMSTRLIECCFWSDKEIAMFTGRPPAWSHRYYSCPLPIDVSDEVLMKGGEKLRYEIDSLDENRWNAKGKVHDAMVCRSMVLSVALVDEVLELFIGNSNQWSMERVRHIFITQEGYHLLMIIGL
jgi:hypothetical protein